MLRAVFTIAHFTFLEAVRARLPRIFLLVVLLSFGASLFLHEIAIADSLRIQTTFLAALLRSASIFLLSLFVIASVARESNEKGLELILSLDLHRAGYGLGKLLGYMTVAIPLAAVTALLLANFAPVGQVIPWGLSLLGELWIMAALSLFCALSFGSILPAVSFAAGFYVLARSMSTIQLIGHGPLQGDGPAQQFMVNLVDAIALILPRLDSFSQTAWLVNSGPTWGQMSAILVQTGVYLALVAAATLFDLSRKNL